MKEVFQAATEPMTTGTVSHAQTLKGWFVLVWDSKDIHPGNKLWGDGWGWSWFDASNYQDDVDRLQSGLPGLPCAGASDRVDLCQRISAPEAIAPIYCYRRPARLSTKTIAFSASASSGLTASSCHSPVLAAVPLLAGLHHPTGVGLPLRAKLTTAGYSVGE